ncbi:MAG: response regulator [Bacteroidetes bacterium]|nr:response regulator [Bacteroidota bacterium]
MKSLKSYVAKGAFYKAVVDDGSDLVFVVDYDGLILYHNAAVKQLGYKKGSLNGKHFIDLLPSSSRASFKKRFRQACKSAFTQGVEFQVLDRDGKSKDFEFNAVNLRQKAGMEGLILDCRDITQRKKVAMELIQAQKAKDLFLANISHEIRTPINGIAGMTTLLDQEISPAEHHTYLAAIRGAAENLKVIINDILDLASIESGKIHFEKIDFSMQELLNGLMDTYQLQAKTKGLSLCLELAPEANRQFIGDPVRVSQIITNLISNAIKFTHKGGITIRCGLQQKVKDQYHIRFEVEDSGIGIPESKLTTIFESFSQADATITRQYGGTGLGLTIARQLVESQKGTIHVSSKVNKGSVFTVTLPFRLSRKLTKSTGKAGKPAVIPHLPQLKVLLVEDNEINRLYASAILKRWDSSVDHAENGKVALEKILTGNYNLILMDVQMPVMDGYEATQQIRRSVEPLRSIPIVGLTAHAARKDIEKCLQSGMDACVLKPFTPEQLYEGIRKYVPAGQVAVPASAPMANTTKGLVNLKYLQEASQNDKGFVRTMLDSLITNLPKDVEEIRSAVNDSNWSRAVEAIHRVKSSLIMIGLENTRKQAAHAEDLLRKGEVEVVPALAEEICHKIELAVEEMKTMKIK